MFPTKDCFFSVVRDGSTSTYIYAENNGMGLLNEWKSDQKKPKKYVLIVCNKAV